MEELQNLPVKPCAKTGLEEELIDGELFLCDQRGDKAIHCLNSGAAMIWYLCDGTRNLPEIVEEIGATTDRPKQEIENEVTETISQFQELGLLV